MVSANRLRPFRAAAYGVHVAAATAFCLFIIWNVVRSVRAMTPPLPPSPAKLADVDTCSDRAQALWTALEERRRGLAEGTEPIRAAHQRWSEFRLEWLTQLRSTQAECSGAHPERAALGVLFQDLQRLEDLYSTHAVQYVGEIGPSVDRFQRDLEKVRTGR
jgi:hypothetical protein